MTDARRSSAPPRVYKFRCVIKHRGLSGACLAELHQRHWYRGRGKRHTRAKFNNNEKPTRNAGSIYKIFRAANSSAKRTGSSAMAMTTAIWAAWSGELDDVPAAFEVSTAFEVPTLVVQCQWWLDPENVTCCGES